ncbi:MAG TPA: hypothetical protein VJX91_00745 [Candidatus Eisenbacteria bacterium]|nr:hypothetical protein [Candidatus Eisenbacteria bacterium]
MMRATLRISTLAVLSAVFLVSNAWAGYPAGVRGGFSSQPDQFVFGVQMEFPPLAKNLYVVPSAEVGVGDDAFSLAVNGDLQYRFHTSSGIRPYAGGALNLYYFDPDAEGADSDTNIGVSALGGLFFGSANGPPLFVDVKLGLTDEVPDWKFMFGVMFK